MLPVSELKQKSKPRVYHSTIARVVDWRLQCVLLTGDGSALAGSSRRSMLITVLAASADQKQARVWRQAHNCACYKLAWINAFDDKCVHA